jgi:hypothetical protein
MLLNPLGLFRHRRFRRACLALVIVLILWLVSS